MSGPVLFKVDPIPHETLMSLAVRVANKNVLPSWHKLLRQAGAKHSNSPTAAANANLDQNQVADIFRLPLEEVAKRCVGAYLSPNDEGRNAIQHARGKDEMHQYQRTRCSAFHIVGLEGDRT